MPAWQTTTTRLVFLEGNCLGPLIWSSGTLRDPHDVALGELPSGLQISSTTALWRLGSVAPRLRRQPSPRPYTEHLKGQQAARRQVTDAKIQLSIRKLKAVLSCSRKPFRHPSDGTAGAGGHPARRHANKIIHEGKSHVGCSALRRRGGDLQSGSHHAVREAPPVQNGQSRLRLLPTIPLRGLRLTQARPLTQRPEPWADSC